MSVTRERIIWLVRDAVDTTALVPLANHLFRSAEREVPMRHWYGVRTQIEGPALNWQAPLIQHLITQEVDRE